MPREYEDDYTFQPKLNARSVAMEQARVERGEVTGQNRGEYLHHKDFEIKHRQEMARKRLVEQELQECTFSPAINRGAVGSSRNHVSIVKNAQLWNERRDEWRHQAAEQQLRKEMQECTFQPNLHRQQYFGSSPAPPVNYNDKDVQDFVERQKAGRAKREQQKHNKEAPPARAEGWTRASTKPQPFKFEHPVKVRALERPAKAAEVVAKAEKQPQRRPSSARRHEELSSPEQFESTLRSPKERVTEFLSKYNPTGLERLEEQRAMLGSPSSPDPIDHSAEGAEERYYKRMEDARRKQAQKREALKKLSGGTQHKDEWTTAHTGEWKGRQTRVQEFHWNKPVQEVRSLKKPVPMMVADW